MNVAVVGATGVVGQTILRVLEERRLPVERLGAFASGRYEAAVQFRGRTYDVLATTDEGLAPFDAVFFAGSDAASERYAPLVLERGAYVIDNSSTFRMNAGVPLIVPEVNAHAVGDDDRLFPVGNCTAIILCVALAPVRDAAGLERVRVATYQAVSGAGRAGLDELIAAERALVMGEEEPAPTAFSARIARNVIPQVGAFDADGYSGEERKVRDETRKVLELPRLPVAATTVRVPVRTAHSEAVFFETQRPASIEELAEAFRRAPGVVYHDSGIVTPRDVEGTDKVHVARLRAEDDSNRHFHMWIVGDQLRKGAATNGVQILELILARGVPPAA
jgi:aspartate-semialdehyde dehydrogenase